MVRTRVKIKIKYDLGLDLRFKLGKRLKLGLWASVTKGLV